MKTIWRQMTLWDKVLIGILILGSISGTAFISLANKGVVNKQVTIKVQNKIVERITVNNAAESKTYSFKFGDNTGYIEVKDGAVRMLKMDKSVCPAGVCSDTGWISKKYQTIVCLPNKIIVNIEQKQEDEVDVIGS